MNVHGTRCVLELNNVVRVSHRRQIVYRFGVYLTVQNGDLLVEGRVADSDTQEETVQLCLR